MNPTRTLAALAIAATCLASACTSSDTAAPTPTPVPTSAPAPTPEPPAEPAATATATSTPDIEPTPTADPVAAIDLDNPGLDVDLNIIADLIARDATGDPEWIDIMATLLARDWLGGRYPAETDPRDVYAPAWIDAVVAENRRLFIESGWYRVASPPRLMAVTYAREVGGLTELRVRLIREPATVVDASDGSVVNAALGGTGPEGSSGLFKIAPTRRVESEWQIHRIDQITDDDGSDGG